jgi:hypothetical protein
VTGNLPQQKSELVAHFFVSLPPGFSGGWFAARSDPIVLPTLTGIAETNAIGTLAISALNTLTGVVGTGAVGTITLRL